MLTRNLTMMIALSIISWVVLAQEVTVRPYYGQTVWGIRTPMEGAVDGGAIAFTEDDLSMEIRLVVAEWSGYMPESEAPRLQAISYPKKWWHDIEIVVTPVEDPGKSGFPAPEPIVWDAAELPVLESSVVRNPNLEIPNADSADHVLVLRRDEVAKVRLELPALDVGDYWITSRMPDHTGMWLTKMTASAQRVAVRKGDENPAVHHTYLRAKRQGQDFETFRKVTLELAEKFEPRNWSLWAELGDISSGVVAPEVTVSYFDRAYQLYVESLARKGTDLSNLDDHEKKILSYLTLFRRLYPILKENADRVYLMPTNEGGNPTFHWMDRETNRRIERVDPDHPGLDARKIPRPR